MVHEGQKLTNDKDDSGGKTYAGITQKWLDSLDLGIKVYNLTPAGGRQIYYKYRWLPGKYDLIKDARVATKVFDLDCHAGAKRAVKILQKALIKTEELLCMKADGILGKITAEYLNLLDEDGLNALLECMCKKQAAYYWWCCIKKPTNIKYMGGENGWLNRAQWKDFGDELK